MKERSPVRRRRWILLCIMGAMLVAVVFFIMPALENARIREEMTRSLNNARMFRLAAQTMSLDKFAGGEDDGGGLPADLKVRSAREYINRLINGNYLSAEDVKKMGWLNEFAVVNVSSSDPKDTAFIISKWLANPTAPHRKGFIVFTLAGSGGIYARAGDATNPDALKLPNRQPQILPQE